MTFSSEFITFLTVIKSKNERLLLSVLIVLFFITVPSRSFFTMPDIKPRGPLYKPVEIAVPSLFYYPVNVTNTPAPSLSARSVIVVDVDSKAVLYAKNPNIRLAPASTTKMVTALVADSIYNPTHVASVSAVKREGQVMFLEEAENITVENLLKGLLIHSANDAAELLADSHPEGRPAFIREMNAKVSELGLTDTHFTNPTGMPEYNHYSTVHDLALIGAEVMSHNKLTAMVAVKNETVTDVTGEIQHPLVAINELLGVVPGLKGIKTGWTEDAGECFVAYIERDNRTIITAVLGSFDRFGETSLLVEWAYANHEWQQVELPQITAK